MAYFALLSAMLATVICISAGYFYRRSKMTLEQRAAENEEDANEDRVW